MYIYIYTELVIYRPYKEHSHSHYLAPASSIPFPFLVEKILGAYDLAAVSRILDLLSHTHPEWWSVAKSWDGLQLMRYVCRFYRTWRDPNGINRWLEYCRWGVILEFLEHQPCLLLKRLWNMVDMFRSTGAWFPWNEPTVDTPTGLTLRSKGENSDLRSKRSWKIQRDEWKKKSTPCSSTTYIIKLLQDFSHQYHEYPQKLKRAVH